jgi:hypothetical protein
VHQKPKKIASRLQFAFNTAAVSASDDFKELTFGARAEIAKTGGKNVSGRPVGKGGRLRAGNPNQH